MKVVGIVLAMTEDHLEEESYWRLIVHTYIEIHHGSCFPSSCYGTILIVDYINILAGSPVQMAEKGEFAKTSSQSI